MADTTPPDKPMCFVIGPIGEDGSEERKHADFMLNGIIKPVLGAKYAVKRADEDAYPGMISDRMISDIINAKLVVADLTNLNPNAFYELGIRHSAGKPAIHIAIAGTRLPFDNAQHRAIFVDKSDWQSIERARSGLTESVQATEAPDYRVSNPITHANGSFQMRASADPVEQILASVVDRLATLEASQEKYVANESVVMSAARQARYLQALTKTKETFAALDLSSTVGNALSPFGVGSAGVAQGVPTHGIQNALFPLEDDPYGTS
jgi:hypothetical protein